MRTAEWRYAEWPRWICNGSPDDDNACSNLSNGAKGSWAGSADFDQLGGRELYSHKGDKGDCFDCYENENLVDKPEYSAVVAALSKQLRAGWRADMPQLA